MYSGAIRVWKVVVLSVGRLDIGLRRDFSIKEEQVGVYGDNERRDATGVSVWRCEMTTPRQQLSLQTATAIIGCTRSEVNCATEM